MLPELFELLQRFDCALEVELIILVNFLVTLPCSLLVFVVGVVDLSVTLVELPPPGLTEEDLNVADVVVVVVVCSVLTEVIAKAFLPSWLTVRETKLT